MGGNLSTFDNANADQLSSVKRTRVGYLAIGAITLLFLGLVYAWSIFATPLADTFGWDRTSLSYTFFISMAAFCIGALLGSLIVRKTSVRVAIFVAACLQASGFILTALVSAQGIWALYIFYGVFAGLGCGIGYNTIISTVNLWFPDKVGFSSGVLMMGFGLGSLILGTAANTAISALGWSTVFIVIGCMSACVLVVLGLTIKMPPGNIEDLVGKKVSKRRTQVPVETKPMLQTPMFYVFFIWAVLLFSALMTLVGDSKQGALELGIDASLATIMVGLISMMNGVARVVSGIIFDRTSLRVAMSIVTVIGVAAISSIACAFIFDLPVVYFTAALLTGFAAGGLPVMSSSFTRERFGAADYPRNLATVNFSIAGSALLSSVVVAIARPFGGDIGVYSTLAVITLLALTGALIFFRLYYKKHS